MKQVLLILFLLLSAQIIFSQPIAQKEDDIIKMGTPILNNILLGIEKKDYKIYSRDFDDTMKDAMPESMFGTTLKQIDDRFGKIADKTYLGYINKGEYTEILWKGKFDKTKDDVLIDLICLKRNGRIYVIGLFFK